VPGARLPHPGAPACSAWLRARRKDPADVTNQLRNAALLNEPIRRVVSEVSDQCRVAVIGLGLIDGTLMITSLMTTAMPINGGRGTGLLRTIMRRAERMREFCEFIAPAPPSAEDPADGQARKAVAGTERSGDGV